MSTTLNGPVVPSDVHNMVLVDALFHSPVERLVNTTNYATLELGVREGEFTTWIGTWDQHGQKVDGASPLSILNDGRKGMRLKAGQAIVLRVTETGTPDSLIGSRVNCRLRLVGGRDGTAKALVSAAASIKDPTARVAVLALERQINTGGLSEWDDPIQIPDLATSSQNALLDGDNHTDTDAASVVEGALIYGSATPEWTVLAPGDEDDVLTMASGVPVWAPSSGGGTPHNLLDNDQNQDTTASTPVRGDLIVANSGPDWTRLPKGTSGDLLQMGENDPAWVAVPTAVAHNLLSDTHSDTTAAAAQRGRWIMAKGTSSSLWSRMGQRSRVLPYMQNRFPMVAGLAGYDQSLSSLVRYFGGPGTVTLTGFSSVPSASGDQYARSSAATTANIITRTNGQEVLPTMHPYMWSFARVVDNVDGAMFIGFNSLTTPTNGTTPTNNSAFFWCRNGTHTNWQAVTRDGTTSNVQDTGTALDGNFHLFEVVSNDGGTSYDFYIDNTLEASSSSNVPVTSTILYSHYGTCINITSSTRTVDYKSFGTYVGDSASAFNWADLEAEGHL